MRSIYTKVLRPANAFDSGLLKFRDKGKEDYAVYYARLSPAKGVLEINKILKDIDKKFLL